MCIGRSRRGTIWRLAATCWSDVVGVESAATFCLVTAMGVLTEVGKSLTAANGAGDLVSLSFSK